VLSGKKKLLKTSDVNWVDEVPRWKEFSAKEIWGKAKNKPLYTPYFPDFTKSKLPDRFSSSD
jgi:hypothetical protein